MKSSVSSSRLALGVVISSTCLALTACGGGGSAPTPSPASVQTAPTLTSSSSVSVAENTTDAFYTAAASDPQNDPVSIELFSGPDADKLVLSANGELRFNENPNFDLPIDANLDNVYEITLRVTAGGESRTFPIRITVTNDREGVRVTRVASGIVDPVAFTNVINEPRLLIAERGGRVLIFDQTDGSITEDIYIRDNRSLGEIVAIGYGFPDSPYQEGTHLLTHSATEGLVLQAFNADRQLIGKMRLGDPWSEPTTASFINSGTLFLAIGDAGGTFAQDISSPYGKLIELRFFNPNAVASVPSPGTLVLSPETIGDGIQRPGGFSNEFGRLYLADQGSTVQHELTIFQTDWRPLDFGWPFYEGAEEVRSNPPAAVNGPSLVYPVGDGLKEGTGIVAGIVNDDNFNPALGNSYVFADTNGTIWSIPMPTLTDGFLQFPNRIENRTLDFVPDVGQIDSPIGFAMSTGSNEFFLLDADGEIFRIDSE